MNFMKLQKSLSFAFAVLFLSLSASAQVIYKESNYKYPYADGYLATISSAITKVDERHYFPVQKVQFVMRADRASNRVLPNRNVMEYQLVAQSHPAPLIFVLPGLGGTSTDSQALAVAQNFYQHGYHVVTIDNPFSWKFSLQTSTTGMVGYTPQDVQDLYAALEKFKTKLPVYGVQVTNYGLVGYSLGAMQAPFLLKVDNERKAFNFKKVLLMNPPVNLAYAINELDELEAQGNKIPPKTREYIYTQIIGQGANQLGQPMDEHYYEGLDKKFAANPLVEEWLIGSTFRNGLGEILFTTQVVDDLGVLKSPVAWNLRDPRYREIKKYSFYDYINRFLVPSLNTTQSTRELIYSSSLESMGDFIANDSRFYLMHNADDFLLGHLDMAWLLSHFKTHAYIYPHGGHCGNFWYKTNREDMASVFNDLK